MTSQQVERFVEAYKALTGVDLDKFSVFKALEEMGKTQPVRECHPGYIQKLELREKTDEGEAIRLASTQKYDPSFQPGYYK